MYAVGVEGRKVDRNLRKKKLIYWYQNPFKTYHPLLHWPHHQFYQTEEYRNEPLDRSSLAAFYLSDACPRFLHYKMFDSHRQPILTGIKKLIEVFFREKKNYQCQLEFGLQIVQCVIQATKDY